MKHPKYPSLYQINTRVWLSELSQSLNRRATLDDIPDTALDQLKERGFDWIWFLSVWCTGQAGRKVSRENAGWRSEFEETLPDLCEDDIGGSGFAITSYMVHPDLGGDVALARLRVRLRRRGLKLMLDFVPNHMAPDHPWVDEHPKYFVSGTVGDHERSPQNYTQIKCMQGDLIFAYGRDPYFSGWPDTLQLDYSNPATQDAMIQELLRISNQCDGLRCDMAMLVLPEVFEKTWGRATGPFWSRATKAVREKVPGFLFMAEVYWDLEWTLQQEGFDYTYDKRLYDRLREGNARAIREHFYAEPAYQNKLARFLENHDEPRAASTFEITIHKAAAVITFFCPGLRFFHQGQIEGRKKRISPHLVRAPQELPDAEIQLFYSEILSVLKNPIFRNGKWQLLECRPAWDGNESWDAFLAFAWENTDGRRALATVNYAPHAGQCYVRLPYLELAEQTVMFTDQMSNALYNRNGNDLLSGGIYLDLPPWGYHIFEVTVPEKTTSEEVKIIVAPKHEMIPAH
jgi:Alpha amylase, catalytic domain